MFVELAPYILLFNIENEETNRKKKNNTMISLTLSYRTRLLRDEAQLYRQKELI